MVIAPAKTGNLHQKTFCSPNIAGWLPWLLAPLSALPWLAQPSLSAQAG